MTRRRIVQEALATLLFLAVFFLGLACQWIPFGGPGLLAVSPAAESFGGPGAFPSAPGPFSQGGAK